MPGMMPTCTQGAALAFFTVFPCPPAHHGDRVLKPGFGREAASGHLVSQIRGLIGIEGAKLRSKPAHKRIQI